MSTVRPGEHGEGKIQGWHRDRLAVIYVRQSSRQQVVDHGESTRLQYGLTGRAAALGWPASRVMVIDEDLGRSAANAAERPGFARLVAEITMGHVGLVLGLEMSRLARAGRDWHQLIELCSLAGALLADADGVYDPNWYNDRLLLGLKGTMSEVELHLIRQRMASGRLAKAGRGELAVPLPAGYARRASGEVALDPDEQVQAVIRLVFRLFEQLGTVHAVLRFLVGHQVQIGMRERSGPGKGEVVWRAPHQQGLVNMLRNPAYAGIYAYGRSRTDRSRRLPGREHSGRARALEAGEWLVRIEGALPAYISVEQYERNLARLAANRARAESAGRAARRPRAAGRAGGLRDLRSSPAGELRDQRAGADRAVLLPAPPSHLRRAALPADGRAGSSTSMSSPRSCRRWPRPRWSCRSPPRRRSRTAGPRSAGSGGSGWNARTSPATGRGASISWPSRRTGWWPASSSASGKPRWPSRRT